MTTAELLARMLAEAGVRWVFGIPSGPVLPLIEALRNSPVEFVLTASETSAGFMAATVGHLTGIPGVCASTLGPGATNLATGVGAAWLDRAPLLAITCNVAKPLLRRGGAVGLRHDALFWPRFPRRATGGPPKTPARLWRKRWRLPPPSRRAPSISICRRTSRRPRRARRPSTREKNRRTPPRRRRRCSPPCWRRAAGRS